MFYSLYAMFFALFFPGYRCRRNNCEHNDVQPMVELHPRFTVFVTRFDVVAGDGVRIAANA